MRLMPYRVRRAPFDDERIAVAHPTIVSTRLTMLLIAFNHDSEAPGSRPRRDLVGLYVHCGVDPCRDCTVNLPTTGSVRPQPGSPPTKRALADVTADGPHQELRHPSCAGDPASSASGWSPSSGERPSVETPTTCCCHAGPSSHDSP